MARTMSRPTRSMSWKGGIPGRVKIRHISSTSSGGDTPSSTTIRHSRLMDAQMRLKMNPSLAPDVERNQAVCGQRGRERIDDTGVRPAAGHKLDGVELRRLLVVR